MPPPSGGLGKTGLTRELAEMLLNAQAVTPNAQRGDAGNGEAEVLTYRRTPLCRWLPGSAPPTVACRPVGVVGGGLLGRGRLPPLSSQLSGMEHPITMAAETGLLPPPTFLPPTLPSRVQAFCGHLATMSLHQLFPLPGMLFPLVFTQLPPSHHTGHN